jgi:hypothetical protein
VCKLNDTTEVEFAIIYDAKVSVCDVQLLTPTDLVLCHFQDSEGEASICTICYGSEDREKNEILTLFLALKWSIQLLQACPGSNHFVTSWSTSIITEF